MLSPSSCFDDLYFWVKLCKSLQRPIESNRNQYSFCSFSRKLFSLGDKILRMSWGYRLLVWQNSLVPGLFVLNIMRYRLVSFLSPLEVSPVRKKSWLGSFGQSKIAFIRSSANEKLATLMCSEQALAWQKVSSPPRIIHLTNTQTWHQLIHPFIISPHLENFSFPRTNLISF